jgi:HAMP domain-containing protein
VNLDFLTGVAIGAWAIVVTLALARLATAWRDRRTGRRRTARTATDGARR